MRNHLVASRIGRSNNLRDEIYLNGRGQGVVWKRSVLSEIVEAMKMAGRPTLVEYKAAGGLGSESRGQSEPVGRAQRQP